MDFHNAHTSDFIGSKGAVSADPGSEVAFHHVRRHTSVLYNSEADYGEVVFSLPLDTALDDATTNLSSFYQRYTIEDITLHVQAASPLGTSSGGVQIGHIPDPYNLDFEEVVPSASNVDKIVRQTGSVLVRPRESIPVTVKCNGTLYTAPSTDLRFSSFGAVVGIARSIPAAGDSFFYEITFTATIKFTIPTYNNPAAVVFSEHSALNQVSIRDNLLTCQLPHYTTGNTIKVTLIRPFKLVAAQKFGSATASTSFSLIKFTLQPEKLPGTFSCNLFNNLLNNRNITRFVDKKLDHPLYATIHYAHDPRSRLLRLR